MIDMNEIDHKNLDWHLLQIFLVVLQESNVTRAARRLELTQSTVSHALNKLRAIFGDPLFVRVGRGIAPTDRAKSLREPVMSILDAMQHLSHDRAFDARERPLRYTVAANDFTRDLLFPDIYHRASQSGIEVHLTFLPSGVPDAKLLQDAVCDLIVTPLPPDGPDIMQVKLFEGEMVCVYDAAIRKPPQSWEEYRDDKHIEVRFASGLSANIVMSGVDANEISEPVISVPNFNAVSSFIKGSDLIATQLNYLSHGALKDLAKAPLPFDCKPVSVYLVWHRRDHTNPANKWLRAQIQTVIKGLMPPVVGAA